ncbi:roadblock/LC7 domain-containing protein [Nonomuraea typhae]|uniref:Roadblock/LC7 domain-containing protein n=1 Tax=Nonomuraea typhae TaxID=2603600 RepID=A0ABW7YSG0_9ACTN
MLALDDCLLSVMDIPGALDALVLDHLSGTVMASGGRGEVEKSAPALGETLRVAMDALAGASERGTVRIDDMIVVTDDGYHLLHPVEMPFDGPLVIYVRLDLRRANLALARHHMQAITGQLRA